MIPRLSDQQVKALGAEIKKWRDTNRGNTIDEIVVHLGKIAERWALRGGINRVDAYQMEARGSGLRYIALPFVLMEAGFPLKEALESVLANRDGSGSSSRVRRDPGDSKSTSKPGRKAAKPKPKAKTRAPRKSNPAKAKG